MRTAFTTGRHLQAARIFAGITQREMAERAGVSPNTVKYWERSKGKVAGWAPDRFKTALDVLGLGPQALTVVAHVLPGGNRRLVGVLRGTHLFPLQKRNRLW